MSKSCFTQMEMGSGRLASLQCRAARAPVVCTGGTPKVNEHQLAIRFQKALLLIFCEDSATQADESLT